MTLAAIRDTLYRKSHRAYRGNAPPSCLRKTALPLKSPTGAFIATQTRTFRKVQSGEDLFPMKIFTAPQHPINFAADSPDKIIAALLGRYFSLWELYLENFMSRLDVIPTFRQRRCTNRGRNFVRSKRRSTYTSSGTLYLFLHLNNSETFVENAF